PERSIVCLAMKAPGAFDVEWDSSRIAQALTNLVSNAVAHGKDPIVVEPEDQGQRIVIEVRNAGEIPAAMLRNIFAPFSQPATDRRRDGGPVESERRRGHLGLGLYLVHEIAPAHGGNVVAESAAGKKSSRVPLPRTPGPPDTGRAAERRRSLAEPRARAADTE